MRIALTGTHSTGKSTVLKIIQEKYQTKFEDYFFFGSLARTLAVSGRKINEDIDDDTQNKIFMDHIENLNNKNMITDRCLLDPYAYTLYSYRQGKLWSTWKHYRNRIETLVKEKYDYIFYFPSYVSTLEKDGVRSDNEKYREDIDIILFSILELYYIDHIVIPKEISEFPEKIAKFIVDKIG